MRCTPMERASGRIDVQGLARDPLALGRTLDEVQRAHVVQAIGQLHHQHADVSADRQDELAEVLALALGLDGELKLGELGDALHKFGDLVAEQVLASSARLTGVSSMMSCSSAVTMVAVSILYSVRMPATSIGWAK